MEQNRFTNQKECDFIRAYDEELKSLGDTAPYVPRSEVILRALHSRHPRFYLTAEEAARHVTRVLQHRPLVGRNECKMSMYQELARLADEYRRRHPDTSLRRVLAAVLAESRASRFYFGEQTARLILSRRYRPRTHKCSVV